MKKLTILSLSILTVSGLIFGGSELISHQKPKIIVTTKIVSKPVYVPKIEHKTVKKVVFSNTNAEIAKIFHDQEVFQFGVLKSEINQRRFPLSSLNVGKQQAIKISQSTTIPVVYRGLRGKILIFSTYKRDEKIIDKNRQMRKWTLKG